MCCDLLRPNNQSSWAFFTWLCVSTRAAAIHLYKTSPGCSWFLFLISFGVILTPAGPKMGSLNQYEVNPAAMSYPNSILLIGCAVRHI